VRGFVPVEKARIPAQAADILAWHERNRWSGDIDLDGERRRLAMIHGRDGMRRDMDTTILDDFVEALRNNFERRRLRAV